VLTLLTLLVIGYLLLARRYRQALLVVIAVVGGTLLSSTLKGLFDRERPSVVPHLTTISDPSFPSGHAMLSSVVYLTLGALLAQAAGRRREHLFFIIAALLLTALVGVSRMALGVHYPSDVLGGWTAGTAWALLCWTVAWWWKRHVPENTDNT
jgi:undecaprenyl-diphosphatase